MRLVLVAEEAAGARAVRRLASGPHALVAVLSSDSPHAGPAREAKRLGIERWPAELVKTRQLARRLCSAEVDLLLNVHSLHVVHPEVLASPRLGSFNLHPGPLPDLPGLNAPSWAIFEGRRRHAVTLHRMTVEVDGGPIAYEAPVDVTDEDTGLTLSARCAVAGVQLIDRLLEDAVGAGVPCRPQGLGRGTFHGREAPFAGRLPWRLSSRRIVDLVRAADFRPFRSPWGHPSCRLEGTEVEVLRTHPAQGSPAAPPGTVGPEGIVAAGDGWVRVEQIRADGVAASPQEVLRPGACFDAVELEA